MGTKTVNMRAFKLVVFVAAALLCLAAAMAFPQVAHAEKYSFVAGSARTPVRVAKIDSKVQKAYNRAVAACMDYQNQPNPIVVDVSDLGLTSAQALHVGYLLHGNGELFWINTYSDDSFKANQFSIPILNGYSDETITAMRAKLEAAIKKALARTAPGMDSVTKIHALHDYLIDHIAYEDHAKTSYDGLVRGKSDCFGFTRTMDLVLKRAGFTVDVAYNNAGNHSWNLVNVGGKWYNIDLTWDNGYTGMYSWKKSRCHYYLLMPDETLQLDDVRGNWWAHHKCTSKKYVEKRVPGQPGAFEKYCNDYKVYTKGFTSGGLKYKACAKDKVKLVSVGKAKRKSGSISIPATVKYKRKTYKVAGIGASALASAKAKKLVVASSQFSKSRVRNSLVGSKVARISLTGSAKAKKVKYRQYFTKSNCGKRVKVG